MAASNRSHLVKMRICNLGCFGPEGVEIALDDIVCLVGQNNTGKSTALRAYEAAGTNAELRPEEVFAKDVGKHPGFVKQQSTVELWVHVPEGAENIDAKWKEPAEGLLLVRSKWTWPVAGGKPTRTTWDPSSKEYSDDGKASGLDTVFNSRLPRPLRIGSLENPADEHKKLLELVLEPIKTKLAVLMSEDGSELRVKLREVQTAAEGPVATFQKDLADVQEKVNSSYRRVFSEVQVQLTVTLGELVVDPGAALLKSSHIGIADSHGQTRWSQQGTGSQRALFWSMLEVRSELGRVAEERKARDKQIREKEKELKKATDGLAGLKKEDTKIRRAQEIDALKKDLAALAVVPAGGSAEIAAPFLPGYMLLIDEPETALHPAAIRAAKDHLYSLASEAGWQVMLSTHHPAFVDPLQDHTTIVRLHRPGAIEPPNVYRADSMTFQGEEKENLKVLLAFDQSVAEMFFAPRVVIVEGDTEYAAFTVAMDADKEAFPMDRRPLLLRARGKWTIPSLVRVFAHFKVNCAVIHDADSPRTTDGGKRSGAYTANGEIANAVSDARGAGIFVIHRVSEPDFERKHGMKLPQKDKPFAAWKVVSTTESVLQSVRTVLDQLCTAPDASAATHPDDGRHFEAKVKHWAETNAAGDPAFHFSE